MLQTMDRTMVITDAFLSMKWQVKILYTNNKVDNYVITAIELAKFINKQRRIARRQRRKTKEKLPLRSVYPMNSWLIDLILEKCKEYITYFKMEDAKMMQVNIKVVD